MDNLLEKGLTWTQESGASYAELRWSEVEESQLTMKNGCLVSPTLSIFAGIAVRVLVDGYWGFAAARIGQAEELKALVEQAVAVAKASKVAGDPISLAKYFSITDSYETPVAEDPFLVLESEKLALLQEVEAGLNQPGIAVRLGQISAGRERKLLVTSEGSRISQTLTRCGGFIQARTGQGSYVQQRSYPAALGGNWATGGFEYIRSLDLPGAAPKVAQEIQALQDAPLCPLGTYDLILTDSMLAHQIHETLGHALELDRVLGDELSLLGGSFIGPSDLGKLQVASPHVNLVADATLPGAPGTYKYDDEGVRGQRVELVKGGMVSSFISNRESAARIGRFSSGTARAGSWSSLPLVRMANICLEPGQETLAELIAGVERGLLLDSCRSYSVDDRRLNFQFGAELGWLIEGGKITSLVRNPAYSGLTPEFWLKCDGVANRQHYGMWAVPYCTKGEPLQHLAIGHGCSAARFRRVKAGGVQ
jgi:TldD protein